MNALATVGGASSRFRTGFRDRLLRLMLLVSLVLRGDTLVFAALDNAKVDPDFRCTLPSGNLAGVQSDGKVIVYTTGFAAGQSNRVVRLLADGTEDPSFTPEITRDPVLIGGNLTEVPAVFNAVLVFPDDTIVVTGNFSKVKGKEVRTLVRLKPDGSLDETWNPLAQELNLFPSAAARGPGGSVWVLAQDTSKPIPQQSILVRRYLADGTRDSILEDGLSGYFLEFARIASLSDGGLLLGGLRNSVGVQFSLIRLRADGSLFPNFRTPLSDFNRPYFLDEFPDGRLLVGWRGSTFADNPTGVRRLLADGGEDTAWQRLYNATVRDLVGGAPDNLSALAALPDASSLVILGQSREVLLINPDGSHGRFLDLDVRPDGERKYLNPGRIVFGPDGQSFYSDALNEWSDGTKRAVTRVVFSRPVPPTIVEQPKSITVNENSRFELKLVAEGSTPLAYRWLRNGTEVNGGGSNPYSAVARPDSAGDWVAVVSNASGSVTSEVAVVKVVLAARILSSLAPITVNEGAAVRLQVTATGEAPLTYVWRRDGIVIPSAVGPLFEIPRAAVGDSGTYLVEVSNVAGKDTSSATVKVNTVLPPPPPSLRLTRQALWDDSGDLAERVMVRGTTAYLTKGEAGLVVLAIQGRGIDRLGAIDTAGHARGVDVLNQHAFVADGPAGLQVIDVSRPATPVRVGGLELGGVAMDVRVHNNVAYVADSRFGVVVVDISRPSSPREITRSPEPASAQIVRVVDGDGIYFASSPDGLTSKAFDTIRSPGARGRFDPDGRTLGSPVGLDVGPSRVYYASADSGLVVLQKAPDLMVLGQMEPMAEITALAAQDNEVVIADDVNGIRLFNTSVPSTFRLDGLYRTEASVTDLQWNGSLLYVVRGSGLELVLINRPVVAVPPRITSPLQELAVAEGQKVLLTAQIEGTRPFLRTQWYRNRVAIPGAIAESFEIASMSVDWLGSYSLEIIGPGGTTIAEVFRLSLSVPLAPPNITLTRNPDGTFTIGGASGEKFRLEYKEHLSDATWQVLEVEPNKAFSPPVGTTHGFYRAASK